MKKLSLIIGLILLTGCTAKAHELSLDEWRLCLKQVANSDYLGADRLHSDTQFCWNKTSSDFTVTPEYEEFFICASGLGNPMFDLSPETTSYSLRQEIYDCLANYPGEERVRVRETSLLHSGDPVRVLIGEELKECRYLPTAIGYAEDVVCY